jgi:hypothetical protein
MAQSRGEYSRGGAARGIRWPEAMDDQAIENLAMALEAKHMSERHKPNGIINAIQEAGLWKKSAKKGVKNDDTRFGQARR